MYKGIITLVSIFLFSSSVQGQFISDFGIKAGLVFSKFNYDAKTDNLENVNAYDEVRISPGISFFMNILEYKYFNFGTELSYLQKGGNERFELRTLNEPFGTGEDLIFDNQYDYLQVGLTTQPKLENPHVRINGLFGIVHDIMLSAKGTNIPKERHTTTNWGYVLGLGIASNHLFNGRMSFEFVYNSDIGNIFKSEAVEFSHDIYWVKTAISLK